MKKGFSLLEIMIVLAVMALIATMSVVVYQPDSPDKKFKKATVEIEALAARGHTMAVLHQKPFWLRFERNRLVLQGSELDKVSLNPDEENEEASSGIAPDDILKETNAVTFDEYVFPEGMEVFLRRWGAPQNAWFHQQKKTDPVLYWNFGPNGLCEPVAIRMEIGKSWAELEMDPLTGRIGEESNEIYSE